jgi:putative aldouronate transport system substrate-binding protein
MPPTVSRRGLLAAGGAAALTAALPALEACSTTASSDTAAADAKVTLPAYVPVSPAKPDLPGTAQGAMPGYFGYPRHPAAAFHTPPAAGLGTVTIMYPTFSPVPAPMNRNRYWQRLNTMAGATLDFTMASGADYPTKFQTMVAGGDVPDITVIPSPVPNQPQLMAKLFADLTPYLGGAHAKSFPFLANIPTQSWKYTVADGGIYAVPQPRAAAGHVLFSRPDLVSQAGADPNPKDYKEFLALLTAVTDPRRHRWATYSASGMLEHLQMMLGAPNGWRVSDGRFVHSFTDERTKQAIGLVAGMVKAGLLHPDAASNDFNQDRTYFTGGRIVFHSDGYAAWDLFAGQIGDDKVGALVPPAYHGGGDARHFAGTATQAITAIRAGLDSGKTRKLVNLLDFLAAPIGTAEHLARKFGVPGVDYTWHGSIPRLTPTGQAELIDVQYVTDAPTILGPGPRERVTAQHDYQVRVCGDLVYDPSVGLYSDTQNDKGSQLSTLITDTENDIFFGRKPLSAWDDAVKQWRSLGGDKVAEELATAYRKA